MTEGAAGLAAAPRPRDRELPTGTVTFLVTDVEGSTRLLVDLGPAFGELIAAHHAILRRAVADAGGLTVSTAGDSVFAVFRSARGAVGAAVAAQRALAGHAWPAGQRVRVRMGLHTGEAMLGGDDYVGLDVHRAARIGSAAHGGQVLLSAATRALVADCLPDGVALLDLGQHGLKDLVQLEHLHQLVIAGLPGDFPPVRSAGGTRVLLPMPRTDFVPRPEVALAADLLAGARLLTLTGPGGTGKTRLAVETALRVVDRFPGGVAFVDLAPVPHPDLVASAVVSTLGLEPGSATPEERLLAHLRDRRALLVLDNFEQVLEAADVVDRMLAAAPGLTVLVTSRAPLRLSGEQDLPVPPLEPPDAVRLFVSRAAAARPSFTLTAENAAAVAEIVRRLDGLPLAVELAAARVRLLPPPALAARLREHGGLAVLGEGARDLPQRQRTLQAAIGWSHALLGPAEQAAFRRLAVFAGGAALEQLEPVLGGEGAGDPLAMLEALVEHSLVREEDVDGQPRFAMLATIREFALERLAESDEQDEVARRHAEAFLVLAETAAPHLTGWGQRAWQDRLGREHDNLRAALDWAVGHREVALAQRLAAALWRFWQVDGLLDEAADRLEQVLALPSVDSRLRAAALEAAGGVAWWRGDMAAARAAYDEALDLVADGEDLAAVANARYNRALTLSLSASSAAAGAELARARSEARSAGAARVEAWAVWGMTDVAMAEARWADALARAEEALAMFRALDDPFGIGWSCFMAATGALRTGQSALARERTAEALRLFAGFRDLTALVLLLWGMAGIEVADGQPERALRLVGASQGLKARTGSRLVEVNEALFEALEELPPLQVASRGLDPARAEALLAGGLALSVDEAVAYALEQPAPVPSDGGPPSR